MSEMKLPIAVNRVVTAINEGDTDAFVAAFTADGAVDDWGRIYRGPDEVRQWARTDAIGANATMTVVTAVTHGSMTRMRFGWTSEVFNGDSTAEFDVAGDQVKTFRILPNHD